MREYSKTFKNSNNAVSEVVGGVILLLMAVVSFSMIYMYVFPVPIPDSDAHVKLNGFADSNGNATIQKMGG